MLCYGAAVLCYGAAVNLLYGATVSCIAQLSEYASVAVPDETDTDADGDGDDTISAEEAVRWLVRHTPNDPRVFED